VNGIALMTDPLDFVFQEQLAPFQFAKPQLIGPRVRKLFLDFTLQCLMLPLEAGKGRLKGHGLYLSLW
jgi:hypothetical protein